MKWSGKFGQCAKMYPTRTNGYENDKRMEFLDQFMAAVALEALRGEKTVHEIAAKRQLHQTQVRTWKRQAIEGMAGGFQTRLTRPRIRTVRSKNFTPRSASWRWRMILGLS